MNDANAKRLEEVIIPPKDADSPATHINHRHNIDAACVACVILDFRTQLEAAQGEIEREQNAYVELQKHRDHWRGYAYGKRDKPPDFLGALVNCEQTEIERLEAEARKDD